MRQGHPGIQRVLFRRQPSQRYLETRTIVCITAPVDGSPKNWKIKLKNTIRIWIENVMLIFIVGVEAVFDNKAEREIYLFISHYRSLSFGEIIIWGLVDKCWWGRGKIFTTSKNFTPLTLKNNITQICRIGYADWWRSCQYTKNCGNFKKSFFVV